MTLKEQISEDIKIAMKAKESVVVSTLRMLIAAFNNMEIEKRAKGEVQEDDYIATVKKEAKKRKEAIEAYKLAGRVESQEQEEAELKILSKYLPEEMGEDDVKKIVDEVVAEKGVDPTSADADRGASNIGIIIGEVIKRAGGKTDGGTVSKLVKEKLG